MIESENERQRKEIIALTSTISRLKEEIKMLEEQKYAAYKRIGELTSEKSQDQIVS